MQRIFRNDPDAAYLWEQLRRADQWPPCDLQWTTWLVLGGRGAGKTRAGAEWVRFLAEGGDDSRPICAFNIALVAESYADAREIMIEGPSGLRAIAPDCSRPVFEASRRRLVWENGAEARLFSAEDPEGIRGFQFDAAWCDELCKWRYPEETWSNLQLALRLGARPRQVVTTTPRPMALLKRLIAAPTTAMTRASTYENRANLADAFFSEIAASYEGTALGRQELMGEVIDDIEGALWSWSMIEAARISAAPTLDRVVVAVDPPASIGPDADECGIVVAGRSGESAYVLADWSVRGLSPRGWAERVIAAYSEFEADRIVVEVNQGGEMARAVIAAVDASAPVRAVHASRSKRVRAEPVAALYERGLVRHVGAFTALEDQMTSFTGEGASPDRLDALVWAVSDLMLRKRSGAPGVRAIG
ncbi:MAG: DNA-packaging protein [Amphiplicatus sp.]|nr:DNA-packaging protein [Amphiplicatus sp.]